MEIKCLIVGELNTNCYLVILDRELIIIDPGAEPKKILEKIRETQAEPKYIINTHSHPDHTSANQEIKEAFGIKILTLEENQEIKIGREESPNVLKVISTPGHTKDSICILGEREDFIFTGDTIFENGYGRTDLPGGSQQEMENSLEKLKKIIKPGITVYPGHGRIFVQK